ncbi:putative transporter C36.03c [Wickerhamiella sorbophila]|uniref:Putative transporter C36.03c n=1 Tax=Wickerhamiella sorbophila TaxID=45607 RepID=A0A2T0FCF8_9ASCO|nr:putative transporter C36.03c [Wickerhamiella sorbophila]PRT52693.1 putative transporter C36.03c [Wickerhamiella sorbophila]
MSSSETNDKTFTRTVPTPSLDSDATSHEDPQAFTVADRAGPMSAIRRTVTHESATDQGRDEVLSEVYTRTSGFTNPLPSMGGKPYPPLIEDIDQYKVEFDGPDDPLCPLNWSTMYKIRAGGLLVLPTFSAVWGSSIYGAATVDIEHIFHVGVAVSVLGVSLYVLGFATGPILWGPLSEIYGRKLPIVVSGFFTTAFSFWAATADHFYHLMLYRFFAGVFASAPLVVVAAAYSDMLPTKARGAAISLFSLCVMGGPFLAPVVGGYIVNSYLGWRWVFYISGILSGFVTLLMALFGPETYHPVILISKARELRERTGNQMIFASQERISIDLSAIVKKVLALPIKMLCREPVLLLMSLYHGFVYGILYLLLEAVPIVFTNYGFHKGNLYLPYLSLFVGVVVFTIIDFCYFQRKFARDLAKSGRHVLPELRLPGMMTGGVLFPIGIFWFCWTGAYHEYCHWIVPTIGLAFVGAGLIGIFLPIFNYLIDTYLMLAASALAANAFTRASMGAAFPIFATAMFHNLGVQWAGTLLGCLAAILVPIPVIFFLYGHVIRRHSYYAPKIE